MRDPYREMSEEEARLTRRENRALGRFIAAFFASCAYGGLAFFAVWRLRDALPPLLYRCFPGAEGGDMARVYIAATIIAAGLAWLITFLLLCRQLNRDDLSLPRKARTLILFCLGAGLALLGCGLLERLALR